MKLSSAESKALSFVLLLVLISAIARIANRRETPQVAVAASALNALESERPRRKTIDRPTRQPRLARGEQIDPNYASADDLDRLPGVGVALAAAIVADRARNGPFLSTADLARVRGISQAKARQLAQYLDLPTEPYPPDHNSGSSSEIFLNSASAAEIDRIEGVSPRVAERIVHVRDSLRGFRDWAQVDAIPGIGPATLKRLQAAATLDRMP
jgi:competence ComEA-like helix-hairpin-helix protein